jgi:UDP-N-acetylglucosamine acyltransferase
MISRETQIDPTARVDRQATIGQGAVIGPFCTIGPHVTLGEGVNVVAHVHVTGHTTIGQGTRIAPFASLGGPPQSTRYRGGATTLVVGANCDIRENVTINIGTEDGGGITTVGDRCMLMVGAHVGHDCHVGNDVIFANNAVLGGHVSVGDFTVLGGQVAVLQYVHIGDRHHPVRHCDRAARVPPGHQRRRHEAPRLLARRYQAGVARLSIAIPR